MHSGELQGSDPQITDNQKKHYHRKGIKFGKRHVPLPSSRPVRIALGIGLLGGGMMFFLPVFGLWMLPLGLLVLSADLPFVRRLRRRLEVWWGRRNRPAMKKGPDGGSGPKALGNGGVSSREDAFRVTP